MRWREALYPMTMQRVALVAPRDALRDLLVCVAETILLAGYVGTQTRHILEFADFPVLVGAPRQR